MGSSRLPKKVLAPLCGRPVLWHVLTRLRRCKSLDDIVVATSTAPENDLLETYCRENGVHCIRGPEDDLLQRYVMAAKSTCADILVRVTGDAPLVDPALIDELVGKLIAEDADYACIDPSTKTIHEGFDPFTIRALDALVREASDDPVAKEHVTAYFKEHPDFVHIVHITAKDEHRFDEKVRLSVDTPRDIAFLEALYKELGSPPGEATVTDVVALLRQKPSLLRINQHVHQKAATELTRRVLIRCDGGEVLGMGHVVRCLALAEALRESFGFGVTFVMGGDPLGMEMVHDAGYPLLTCHIPNQVRFLNRFIQENPVDAVVFDLKDDLPAVALERWSDRGILTVVIDDSSDRRLAADLMFYPPVPQIQTMSWKEARGELFSGWKWIVLRRQFAERLPRNLEVPPTVLITMGGSDPAGMTLKAIDGVLMLDSPVNITVVLGQAFSFHDEIDQRIALNNNITIEENVTDMAALMRRADLAVAAFGVTAYELASQGVPAIYICSTNDHRQSAATLEKGGMARCLGLEREVEPPMIHEAVRRLLSDAEIMERMSKRASARIDGRGSERIAAEIDKWLTRRSQPLGR